MDESPSPLRIVLVLIVMASLSLLFSVMGSEGQTVTTSITPSPLPPCSSPCSGSPTAVFQSGTTVNIYGGARPGSGSNLFHSFQNFSVGTGDTALFRAADIGGAGPVPYNGASIQNIIGRVTGNNPSGIFGTLNTQSAFPTANLFLINPAGIVFGPTASLNVGGSVHFSTVDYLRLGSGNDRFYADLGKASQLTSAPVTAFGFLGEHPASLITVQAGSQLTVNEGKEISLIGGDISITGRTLSSQGGLLSIISAGGANIPPARVEISPSPSYQPASLPSQGTVILDGVTLQSSSSGLFSGAGTILISGGKLVLSNATVEAIGHGRDIGASITGREVIPKSGDIKIYTNEGAIQGSTLKTGVSGFNANTHQSILDGMVSGDIEFSGGAITVLSTTINTTPTADLARVGSVNLRSDGRLQLVDTKIAVDANLEQSVTPSGSISIHAGDIELLRSSGSQTRTTLSTTSNAGFDPVRAGTILLEAERTVTTRGANIQTKVSSGDGGNVSFTAGQLIQILDDSHVVASSGGAGKGGNVSIMAPAIVIQGSSVGAQAGSFLLDASGGNVTITAQHLVHLRNSKVTTSSNSGAGAGGDITIDPDAVVVQNSQILAQAIQGRGGDIKISAGILLIDPSSVIKADSQNQALSGTINIQAPIQQLAGAIAPLPQAFAVATNLYGQRCATQKGGQFSSFVEGARDGVPPQPGDLIPSPLLLESEGISPSLASQSSPNLAAVRLGLPDFYHPAPVTFLLSTGCRS